MNKGMQRYLDSLPPGSVKHFTVENCPALAEYERQMREETIPKIERAIKAQRRAAHFACLGIPDPLAIVDCTATAAANEDLPVPQDCQARAESIAKELPMTKLTKETEDVVAAPWPERYYMSLDGDPFAAGFLKIGTEPSEGATEYVRADVTQSLSDRIDRLEAQLTLLAGIEDAPPQRTGPAEYGDDRLPQKIWDKIEVREDGCWFWHGRMGTHGYGQISGSYQSHNAHRHIYAALIDRVPDDLVCDHLCRERRCVNPAHIELVTNAENVRRGNVLRTGNQSSSRKLSEDEVKIIYSYKGQHGMGTKLSQRFRINQGTIYKIWSGEHWASVTGAVWKPSLIKEGGR